MSEQLTFMLTDKSLTDLINLQRNGQLNLWPSFQRDSVWRPLHRRKFIRTILDGFPVPSIFLYRDDAGMYHVLDGKQRLETIFKFARIPGIQKEYIEVKHKFPDDEVERHYDWGTLVKRQKSAQFCAYQIQVVEVRGDMPDIVELFVRINSTGAALTRGEISSAKFYKTAFMKDARRLAKQFRRYFEESRVVSPAQVTRMKDIELISELMASLANGGPINKKAAVDKAIQGDGLNGHTLGKVVRELVTTMNLVRKMLPDLYCTRFHNISEFYSLFMVVYGLQQQKLVLSDSKRNRQAQSLITRFSNGVDDVRERQKKLKGARPDEMLYTRYLFSVQQSTDTLAQRKIRAEILEGLFTGLFEKKDEQRIFSPEQRRLLWNSEDEKYCPGKKCGHVKLTWENLHIDHVKAHSHGGATTLENAQLLCEKCNKSKGAK